ncbi:MAG: DUF2961 domain-containing protein [Oscillospiraceae bacterium]|nr:DUF2961 domain-containing protein [Oscillospiraceae bacterium]
MFNGLNNNLGNLYKLTNAKTRSVSPENFTGEKGKGGMAVDGNGKGAGRELGQGWKISPCVTVKSGEIFTMADIKSSGAINHIWCTTSGRNWRDFILRIYWDGMDKPSVECPLGDFFCAGWGEYIPVTSLAVCVNPGRAFNSYWNMPFKKGFKMTLENRDKKDMVIFYQIDYTEAEFAPDEEIAYFHAQFRRANPLPYKEVYTILDGVKGKGQFVGTYLAWQVNNNGWWGEGEIKFFMDGDNEFPTICGTGTEDYFCGSYDFENPYNRQYEDFTSPYAGFHQILRSDELYRVQKRFGMYRWHITDPIRFDEDLKVTIQALGWRSEGRYLPLQDDIASVAYWYQTLPMADFPELPDRDYLEVI